MANPAGVIDLLKLDAKLDAHPAWKNPNVKGVRARTSLWSVVKGNGVYDFNYLDTAANLAAANGKILGFGTPCLAQPPQWLKDMGVKTIVLDAVEVVLPDDHIFQDVLASALLEIGKRYDGKITYYAMSGVGQPASESYMARTLQEQEALAAVGFTAATWEATIEQLATMHTAAFKKTIIEFTAAKPFPDASGQDAVKSAMDSLMTRGAQFGLMNAGLNDKTNADGVSVINKAIKTYAPSHPCGFQMVGNSNDSRLGSLSGAITAGITILGGKGYLEIYDLDITEANAALLSDTNNKLGAP